MRISAAIADYGTRVGLDYELIPDQDTSLTDVYRVVGFPTHYFVDRSGTIAAVTAGSLDRQGMESSLQTIMP